MWEGFPGGTSGKEPTCQCRRHKRWGFNPWVGKIPWRGHGNPLQYSYLENPHDRGAWQAMVHRVAKNWTQLKQLSTHARTHGRGPGKLTVQSEQNPHLKYCFYLKTKDDVGGIGLGPQRGRKQFTWRWKNNYLGKDCFLGWQTMGRRVDSALCCFPQHTWLTFFARVAGEGSIPGTEPLSKFFQAVKEKIKVSSWVFLALIVFSSK